MAFTQPLDIANRALQRLGLDRLKTFAYSSRQATETAFAYDKLRAAELEGNLWKFATKRVVLRSIGIDTVLWTPAAWASAQSYAAGYVASYAPTSGVYSGQTFYWQLSAAETSSATPDNDPLFHRYWGPLAIDLYDTGPNGNGNPGLVYAADEVVLVPAAYNAGTTYAANDVASDDTAMRWYVSLVASNIGNTPSTSPTKWALWTDQGRGNSTFGKTTAGSPVPLTYPGTSRVYRSLYSGNQDNPLSGAGSWLNVGGTVAPLTANYPVGAGPNHDLSTNFAFYLPNAFLKRAPTDPQGGRQAYLGAMSGRMPEDYVEESGYLVSQQAGPIMVRFVADVIDVTDMDPLFCEGLSACIAMELCETLSQDKAKYDRAVGAYNKIMGRARIINAIEIGPITQTENRYVTVRI